ncbi:MAG: hypothetical protein MSIBF_06090 [Candidatus Altiarchaeales archaeon IMC4]|nr:MAG: hypothetical protein MSIBF_06090 [Candidatus Altiarchaeales archaeon IMC4]
MVYANIDIEAVKQHMGVIYRELSELRNQFEMLESLKKKDAHAFERLDILGKKIEEQIGTVSTKDIMDDIRG